MEYPKFYTATTLCKELKISRASLNNYMKAGTLRVVRSTGAPNSPIRIMAPDAAKCFPQLLEPGYSLHGWTPPVEEKTRKKTKQTT